MKQAGTGDAGISSCSTKLLYDCCELLEECRIRLRFGSQLYRSPYQCSVRDDCLADVRVALSEIGHELLSILYAVNRMVMFYAAAQLERQDRPKLISDL